MTTRIFKGLRLALALHSDKAREWVTTIGDAGVQDQQAAEEHALIGPEPLHLKEDELMK
jgi:hypothetical protein